MKRTIEYVSKHTLNTSKTKQAHVFSKSPRFSKFKQSPCHTTFYDLSKSAIQIRKKSPIIKFNRQKRFLQEQFRLNKFKNDPSPLSYHVEDYFQNSRKKRKGITFKQSPKSREKISFMPGPATYQPTKYNPQHTATAFISNTKRKDDTHWNKLGPGDYNQKGLSKSAVNIKIGNAKRFRQKVQHTPSPGAYHKQKDITAQSCVRSRSPKFSFGTSKKNEDYSTKQTSPGPGSYNNSFSQFSQRSKRIYEILKRL